ncbi:MAG: DUF2255 family protein [Solirubrobacteraceae bacterium]
MSTWTPNELAAIVAPDELQIATLGRDGTVRDPVTIWALRHGDELYIRSVNGPTAAWYRRAHTHRQARVAAGCVVQDVELVDADHRLDEQIDAEYRTKYRRYSENTLERITSPNARSTTLKLVPAPPNESRR